MITKLEVRAATSYAVCPALFLIVLSIPRYSNCRAQCTWIDRVMVRSEVQKVGISKYELSMLSV